MSAFERWFKQTYDGRPEEGAEYLFFCCTSGSKESIAWKWLEKTGDKHYTADSFIKASKLILACEESPDVNE